MGRTRTSWADLRLLVILISASTVKSLGKTVYLARAIPSVAELGEPIGFVEHVPVSNNPVNEMGIPFFIRLGKFLPGSTGEVGNWTIKSSAKIRISQDNPSGRLGGFARFVQTFVPCAPRIVPWASCKDSKHFQDASRSSTPVLNFAMNKYLSRPLRPVHSPGGDACFSDRYPCSLTSTQIIGTIAGSIRTTSSENILPDEEGQSEPSSSDAHDGNNRLFFSVVAFVHLFGVGLLLIAVGDITDGRQNSILDGGIGVRLLAVFLISVSAWMVLAAL